MSITIDQLKEIFDDEFCSAYITDVSAEIEEDEGERFLNISIGRRDVTIDEDGNVVGSGSFIG